MPSGAGPAKDSQRRQKSKQRGSSERGAGKGGEKSQSFFAFTPKEGLVMIIGLGFLSSLLVLVRLYQVVVSTDANSGGAFGHLRAHRFRGLQPPAAATLASPSRSSLGAESSEYAPKPAGEYATLAGGAPAWAPARQPLAPAPPPSAPPSSALQRAERQYLPPQTDSRQPETPAAPSVLPAALSAALPSWMPGATSPAAAAAPEGGCTWEQHPDKFLGGCVEPQCSEYGLEEAKNQCLDRADECSGVTCETSSPYGKCMPRQGSPYLEPSPSGEVSYIHKCGQGRPVDKFEASGGGQSAGIRAMPSADAPAKLQRGELLGRGRAVVVVIAHNRDDCLRQCLSSLAALPEADVFPVAVSLDDPQTFRKMEGVARSFGGKLSIDVWKKTDPSRLKHVVAKISEHFLFALVEAFDQRGFEYGIFLENDLAVAPDFLWYFRSTAWLLEEDSTLFCVSAWNDNAAKDRVLDEKRLFRTDYFPGLGWMIRKDTWSLLRGQWPPFPSTGWDHWLRHGSGLRPRECIAPEVPRTHHFDTHGANVRQGSKLAKSLTAMPFSSLPPGQLGDLSYLLEATYQADLASKIKGAQIVNLQHFMGAPRSGVYALPYVREEYPKIAAKFNLSPAQPRTAHRGVIITQHGPSQSRVYLVDKRQAEGFLPESYQLHEDPRLEVVKAQRGVSCDGACNTRGLRCDVMALEWVNKCAVMRQHFPCENGCGHQVGKEVPCYVSDTSLDTGQQCLVTDDAFPTCAAKHPSTSRLCACMP